MIKLNYQSNYCGVLYHFYQYSLCFTWKGFSLVESNQQIYNFCKLKFCISKLFIQCNTSSCWLHIAVLLIYIYMRVSFY